jgi:hypothetical protein
VETLQHFSLTEVKRIQDGASLVSFFSMSRSIPHILSLFLR